MLSNILIFCNKLTIKEEIKEEQKELAKRKKECKKKVKIAKKLMENTFCPILQGNCKTTCIHYKKGFVDKWEFMYKVGFDPVLPTCKLWEN